MAPASTYICIYKDVYLYEDFAAHAKEVAERDTMHAALIRKYEIAAAAVLAAAPAAVVPLAHKVNNQTPPPDQPNLHDLPMMEAEVKAALATSNLPEGMTSILQSCLLYTTQQVKKQPAVLPQPAQQQPNNTTQPHPAVVIEVPQPAAQVLAPSTTEDAAMNESRKRAAEKELNKEEAERMNKPVAD